MATDREVMQQALEALELEATRTPIPETAAAMAALRARLAEPEPEPVVFLSPDALEWLGVRAGDLLDVRVGAVIKPLRIATRRPLMDSEADALAHEMVKGGKSVQWLVRAIERNITGGNDE